MNKVYIALGSNIEPREDYLNEAMRMLSEENVTIVAASSIYETEPVGYADQGNFLNMVIEVDVSHAKLELLDLCQEIEGQLGRKRTIKNGPRTVDLDILFFNDEIVQLDRLILPHPRLHERAFVLVPLNEIASDIKMPGTNISIKELVGGLSEADLKEVVKWREV